MPGLDMFCVEAHPALSAATTTPHARPAARRDMDASFASKQSPCIQRVPARPINLSLGGPAGPGLPGPEISPSAFDSARPARLYARLPPAGPVGGEKHWSKDP